MKKKLKVRVVFEFADLERRALNRQLGKRGLATRAECVLWLEKTITSTLQTITSENDPDQEIPWG